MLSLFLLHDRIFDPRVNAFLKIFLVSCIALHNRNKCSYWHWFVSVAEEPEAIDRKQDGLWPTLDLSRNKSREVRALSISRAILSKASLLKYIHVQIKGGSSTVQKNSWCIFYIITQQNTRVLFSETIPDTVQGRICDTRLIRTNWQEDQLMHD